MLEQYLSIKKEHPDCLLFFRMGDFYELFFEDARTAAKELQITLTARNPNSEIKVPMCGVPYHACQEYLRQLLEKGHKVAVCDQVEDAGASKGLVRREVTRVLTPGTVVEDTNLTAKENNYLGALYWDKSRNQGALAWAEFSTGEWSGLEMKNEEELWQWLRKLSPSELLLPHGYELPGPHTDLSPIVNFVPQGSYFEPRTAAELILKSQQAASLRVLDLEDKPFLLRVCGAILVYLVHTHRKELNHLADFKPLKLSRHLYLDEATIRNLELFRTLDGRKGRGTLIYVLDRTQTPMGGRYLQTRLRQPWKEAAIISGNQAVVEGMYMNNQLRAEVRRSLEHVHDLERLTARISINRCSPKDLAALGRSLQMLPVLGNLLKQSFTESPVTLAEILKKWDDLEDVALTLNTALLENPSHLITEGGIFKTGYDSGLDELIELADHGETKLKELLEKERTKNGLPKLKMGYNRVFGYFFELSKAVKDRVPDHFERRQTLASSERYVTAELKDLENSIMSASEQRKSREFELFAALREFVAGQGSRLRTMAASVSLIDYWQGLAQAAREWEWTKPEIDKDIVLQIRQGRHPVVEAIQGRSDYVPNDLSMGAGARILLITGPNMAGKSTFLRQTALIVLLAQAGSFVPAEEARVGIVDRIFCRVGAADNLARGESTFLVEMNETANILRNTTAESLVIMDEVGRGTSTRDGLAIAWAVSEYLARHARPRTLFATHFHELTELAEESIFNLSLAVSEQDGEVVFLKLVRAGPSNQSYGVQVARIAGLPEEVLARAEELMNELVLREQAEAQGSAGALSGAAGDRGAADEKMPAEQGRSAARRTAANLQAELFDPGEMVTAELSKLDIEHLTPIEALNLLSRWQQQLRGSSGGL